MALERKPAQFGDLRGWLNALREAGELHEVTAEVDWNIELGTIVRVAQGAATGPALLFSNIKDYNKPGARGRRVFAARCRTIAGWRWCSACTPIPIQESW